VIGFLRHATSHLDEHFFARHLIGRLLRAPVQLSEAG